MGRDEALYARSKRGDLVCAMQTWSPRLWPTNWRASTFVFDKLSRQFMQRCARGFQTQHPALTRQPRARNLLRLARTKKCASLVLDSKRTRG